MTPRERFRAVMNFEKPDRLPWYEWPGTEATYRWIREGLPISETLAEIEGPDGNGALSHSFSYMVLDPSRYFGFETLTAPEHMVIVDQCTLPRYFAQTLEETPDNRIIRSIDGTKKKIRKGETYSMPMWLEWPVKNRDDWGKLKARLDPRDNRRYPKEWNDEYVEYLRNAPFPVEMWFNGFYAMGRTHMGTERFTSAFYTEPELVREMMDYHANFLIESITEAVQALGSSIDIIVIDEDVAYKHGPHVSPKLFREFILPHYKKLTDFLKQNGIKNIFVDSDGNIAPLVPLLLEGGVNGLLPLEVASGMDAVALSKIYGRSLRMIGNIDKRALAKSKAAIEKEIQTKLPYLKEAGGFIPMLDHVIPPDISLEHFMHYSEYLMTFL